MTREEYLNWLILLSQLESLLLMTPDIRQIPDGVFEDIDRTVQVLRKQILE